MVSIHMRVAELDDELVCVRVRDMCDHMGEESIRGDVERDPQAKVCGTLVHEAGEFGFRGGFGGWRKVHIELAHHVARGRAMSGISVLE